MKVALVYDRVNKWGGAERVLLALHEIWPKAPLFTAVYNPQTAPWAEDFVVIPSFLNKIPYFKTRHETIPFLMPIAFESFNFDEFDVVISVTSEFAKSIITKPKALHICYCLTPTRYLWSAYEEYFSSSILRFVSLPFVSYLRRYDKIASQRPDFYIAISQEVQRRIEKYYGRPSKVIYPGINIDKFKIQASRFKLQASRFFLIVSRLVPYKRVDLAIKAFNQLGLPLKIIGDGVERGSLERLAQDNIEFLGQELTDEQVLNYYQECQALIFPAAEDFGLVSLEAQACGKPVIAFRGGGVIETILESKTGEFFYPQTSLALKDAVLKFDEKGYNPRICRQQAEKFDIRLFKKQFQKLVEKKWREYAKN